MRPRAIYTRSLDVLAMAKELYPETPTKTGFMLGVGEERDEVKELLTDLRAHDVEIVTIGQYLRPSLKHHPLGASDAGRVRGAQGVRPVAGIRSRRERPAGAQLVSRPRTGGGGERGVSTDTLEYLWLGRVPYGDAWVLQRSLAQARARGEIGDVVLLLEHPPVYTMGRQGSTAHVPTGPSTWLARRGVRDVDRGGW